MNNLEAYTMNDLEDLHQIACINNESTFIHPETGFHVMTASFLKTRKRCCGNKCTFCPYGHVNVKNHKCTLESCSFQLCHGDY